MDSTTETTVAPNKEWAIMELWDRNGYDTYNLFVGGVKTKDSDEFIPVAFVSNGNLKDGWKEIRLVHESSPRSDYVLFIDLSTAGFVSPEDWEKMKTSGSTKTTWEETGYEGAFLFER